MKRLLVALAGLALVVFATVASTSSAIAKPSGVKVDGDGRATLTYDQCVLTNWGSYGNGSMPGCVDEMDTRIRYDIKARLDGNGNASGTVRIKIGNPFERDSWYTAPEAATAEYAQLDGEITSITVRDDGAVVLAGMTESHEYDTAGNVFFCAADDEPCNEGRVPIEIIIGGELGKTGMTLNWCLYPGPFDIKFKKGDMKIQAPKGSGHHSNDQSLARSSESQAGACGRGAGQ